MPLNTTCAFIWENKKWIRQKITLEWPPSTPTVLSQTLCIFTSETILTLKTVQTFLSYCFRSTPYTYSLLQRMVLSLDSFCKAVVSQICEINKTKIHCNVSYMLWTKMWILFSWWDLAHFWTALNMIQLHVHFHFLIRSYKRYFWWLMMLLWWLIFG